MRSNVTAILVVLVLMVFGTAAIAADMTKVTKQLGGSTGDSLQAAPDTSSGVPISKSATVVFAICASDSLTIYTTQVSPDNTNWFTVDVDTVAIGEIESTADLGAAYAGMSMRVIQDQITTGTWSSFGAAWVVAK